MHWLPNTYRYMFHCRAQTRTYLMVPTSQLHLFIKISQTTSSDLENTSCFFSHKKNKINNKNNNTRKVIIIITISLTIRCIEWHSYQEKRIPNSNGFFRLIRSLPKPPLAANHEKLENFLTYRKIRRSAFAIRISEYVAFCWRHDAVCDKLTPKYGYSLHWMVMAIGTSTHFTHMV